MRAAASAGRRPVTTIVVLACVAVLAVAGCGGQRAQAGSAPTAASPRQVGDARDAPGRGFPDAGDTGARETSGTRGAVTVSRRGTVLEDVTVKGRLTIAADDVTVRNVRVEADGDSYGILVSGRHVVISDTTVVGTPGRTVVGIAANEGSSVVVQSVDVSKCEDGVRLASDSSLSSSYVHDLRGNAESHYDGVTAEGGAQNWRIIGNTILNDHTQTSAVTIGDPKGQPSEGVLSGNYISGGGYAVYSGPGTGRGVKVLGNVFSTQDQPKGGYWGAVAYWSPGGNVWRGNVWADGPDRGRPVSTR